MKLETFFEKFELFAAAPHGVQKLRELVLDLAVTGRLVPSTGGWETRPLQSLATKIGSGATPTGGRASYFREGVPLIRSMNVHFRGFIRHGLAFLSDKQAKALSNVTVEAGDVLLNITGASIGRVTTAPAEMAGARVNQHVAIIRPTVDLVPSFLALFLASPTVQRMIDEVQVGATRQALTKSMIEAFKIPLPTRAEQMRIVAKVDELLALCDRLDTQQLDREARHATLANASVARFTDAPSQANLNLLFHGSYAVEPADVRRSILRLAVQGRLVVRDPKDKAVRASFPILAAVAVENRDCSPDHWLQVPLGEVGEWRGGGTPSKSKPDFWDGSIPWVSPKDMKVFRVADAEDHISGAAVEGSSVRMIPAGSVLMVVRGMILARAFPVAITAAEVTINQDMKALIPAEPETAEFLLLVLRALEQEVLGVVERSTHGTCKLQTNVLHQLRIPIPPLAEQRRIVARVGQLMGLVDRLENQIASSTAAGNAFTEAVVAEQTTQS